LPTQLPTVVPSPVPTVIPTPIPTTAVCGVGEYLIGDGKCALCPAGQYQVLSLVFFCTETIATLLSQIEYFSPLVYCSFGAHSFAFIREI
jgi:hypothetical protein